MSTANRPEPVNVKAIERSITLNAIQISKIQDLFGGAPLKDGDDLIEKLTRTQQIRLGDGVTVTLTPEDLWQLKQQAIGMSRDYKEYVKSSVEEAVGYHLNGFFVPRG